MKTISNLVITTTFIILFTPLVFAYPIFSYDSSYEIIHLQEERIFSSYFQYTNLTNSYLRITFIIEKTKDVPEGYDYIFIPIPSHMYVNPATNIESETIFDEITKENFNLIKLKLPRLNKGDKYIGEVSFSDDSTGWGYDEENDQLVIKLFDIPEYVFVNLNKKNLVFSDTHTINYYLYFPNNVIEVTSFSNEGGNARKTMPQNYNLILWKFEDKDINTPNKDLILKTSIKKIKLLSFISHDLFT